GPESRVVSVPVSRKQGLAKYEPERGCFIGAFVLRDINISGRMTRWEELTRKGHASYLCYVGYGRAFPRGWVADVRSIGAVPNIALEPNDGLDAVRDDGPAVLLAASGSGVRARNAYGVSRGYLREFAREAAASGGPVFLRFASEMNGEWTRYHGDPALYREK